ncbi:MAG: hypothetical protein WCK59_03460 [Candidatus Falkowbacteria bacterium]
MRVNIGATAITLDPSKVIGKGGEADIYDIGNNRVLKLFKQPSHTDYEGLLLEQQAANLRLTEHQLKLPAFPKNLPAKVIAPRELATDTRNQKIVGYVMPFIYPAEVLLRYGERSFREGGISDQVIIEVFKDLHQLILGVHQANAVIGDFNDLNVLVKGSETYLIDADSMQFGQFYCRLFTGKFVDPLLCDPNSHSPKLIKPHNLFGDWYSYNIMLMQSLLYVGPYGGIHKPNGNKPRINNDARPLKRMTVFNSEVRYPKPARPFQILPDDLLQYFHQVFEKDKRGIFPLNLLSDLRWTKCNKCGAEHARKVCPECNVAVESVKEVITATVTARKIFETNGRIIFADNQDGRLIWLYNQDGHYYREDKGIVSDGNPDPYTRYRLSGIRTIMAKGNQAAIFEPAKIPVSLTVESYGQLPLIAANGQSVFYITNGQLGRMSELDSSYFERIGDVLSNQTLFWVGPKFGFGFYRAGQMSQYFVFSALGHNLNDSVKLPQLRGQLIDSTCVFGANRIWFLVSTRASGNTINRCYLMDENGNYLASTETPEGDGSWLGTIRGKCAAGKFLLAATDDGIVRIEPDSDKLIVTKEFPDTARFVDANSNLFPGKDGLMIVKSKEIWSLSLK